MQQKQKTAELTMSTSVRISDKTRDRLVERSTRKDQTYEDIISALLDATEPKKPDLPVLTVKTRKLKL